MPSRETRVKLRNALRANQTSEEIFNLIYEATGSVFYVSSVTGRSTNSGKSTEDALATIDQAINKCSANVGDCIVVMPQHTETITAAAGIDFDVAGITCVGIGNGTDRPQITFSTATTADIDIAAANVMIRNIHFINDIDSLAAPFDVDAAHFTIEDCLFDDATASKQTVRWILGDANADYMTVRNCTNHGSDTAGATACVTLNGADHVVIQHLVSHGDFSAANIQTVTAACTDLLIEDCVLENANGVDVNIEGIASQTGWIRNCSLRVATDGQVTWINTPGNMSLFENYGVNNDGETGKLVGTASI